MRDVNRGRKGFLGLGGPRDKPNYTIGGYSYILILTMKTCSKTVYNAYM
jgi:hypothetical protein